ncbi:sodium transporter [Kineobactrum sediminis]|uniref:Sodium transporter n=1 Tax=Kineobactrum sediminis TaxID=1905677 RepID=A0A2N5Y2F6_9GAMM|nr:sodium/sugar symporter [Kineobactrum sediminis]PLW82572.1 sodium transporter [Kineobactrum sediminis]
MLGQIDLVIVFIYAVSLFALAQWVSREKAGHVKDAQDYFLAGRALPWWAIGASMIAANISAEQIIGMSGSGFAIGLAIASYEWMAAITLLLVGKYLLPIFLKMGIYTMPQFLEQRYDSRVRTVMAGFWLGVYVFVNLTAILWLGALAINTVTGLDLILSMILLGAFAVTYSLYGGLKAVAFTDIIQVVLLVLGGILIITILLQEVSGGAGVFAGFVQVLEAAPEKFDMILSRDHPYYKSLPGISVLVGGMWIMNLSYWGFNQYIIQRALAAKSIDEAQKGIAFAAFLKVLMPMIVVLPGIIMFVLEPDLAVPDQAYPQAMTLLPTGIKGLVFAALLAAIVSSLASMCNSISTIFTVDLFSRFGHYEMTPARQVKVGRIVSVSAMLIAMITAKPLLGNFDQAFQYIQEFTGFFTPGIVAIFLLGMFYKPTTATAALVVAIGSAVLSLAFKLGLPDLPFIDRVGLVFLMCIIVAVVLSHLRPAPQIDLLEINHVDFGTSQVFNLSAVVVILLVAALYAVWW